MAQTGGRLCALPIQRLMKKKKERRKEGGGWGEYISSQMVRARRMAQSLGRKFVILCNVRFGMDMNYFGVAFTLWISDHSPWQNQSVPQISFGPARSSSTEASSNLKDRADGYLPLW